MSVPSLVLSVYLEGAFLGVRMRILCICTGLGAILPAPDAPDVLHLIQALISWPN